MSDRECTTLLRRIEKESIFSKLGKNTFYINFNMKSFMFVINVARKIAAFT